MAVSLRGVAAVHGKAVRENLSTDGRRLLVHLNMAMVTAALLAVVGFLGYQNTSWACDSRPVILKSWFETMCMLQGVSGALFWLLHMGLASLTGGLLRRLRAAPAQEPEAPPEAGAPQGADEEFCLIWSVLSSTMLLFVLTGSLLMWCFLGIYIAVDAGGREACDSGTGLAWAMAILGIFQACCCHIFTTADAHVPRVQEATTDV